MPRFRLWARPPEPWLTVSSSRVHGCSVANTGLRKDLVRASLRLRLGASPPSAPPAPSSLLLKHPIMAPLTYGGGERAGSGPSEMELVAVLHTRAAQCRSRDSLLAAALPLTSAVVMHRCEQRVASANAAAC